MDGQQVGRTPADSRRWCDEGTELFLYAVRGVPPAALDEPSGLPGWTRRHVVAHVAANADALRNLVRWAATGEPSPMYSSPEERAAGIERGVAMPAPELDAWLRLSCAELAGAMDRLTDEQWTTEVVTAQGRTVPATEVPWMRAREVCVHAVDLAVGMEFADLGGDFLTALCVDVQTKRGKVSPVDGPLDQRAAYLTGRPHRLVGVPELGAWL